MKKFVLIIVAVVFVFIMAMITYISLMLPNVGKPEDITVEITEERVERGAYLANAVMVCMDCHSLRDWEKFSGPPIPGTLGQGGEEFNHDMGFPGHLIAPNITPFNLGDWTDGEILRAIAEGVNKDGKALFPLMPHPNYGTLDREDLYDIIAYLRTLKPIEKDQPEGTLDFPVSVIVKMIPQEASFSKRPDASDEIAYGEYLYRSATCTDCHTMFEKGKYVEAMKDAGGRAFPMPSGGIVRSANLTPDKETGLGNWSREMFLNRFHVYSDSTYVPMEIKPGDYNSIMPWMMYAQMTDEDLGAIYTYLQSLEPIKNSVIKFTP